MTASVYLTVTLLAHQERRQSARQELLPGSTSLLTLLKCLQGHIGAGRRLHRG